MKSNVCRLASGGQGLVNALDEVEKAAAYNNLGKKNTLHLRLLAEELLGMVKELLGVCEGTFWVEQEGRRYELHVQAEIDSAVGSEKRRQLLSVSSTGKNASAKGIMGKIRSVVETMAADADTPLPDGCLYFGMGIVSGVPAGFGTAYDMQWSLNQYRQNVEKEKSGGERQEEWDELEKSIVAKLASDVIVGIQGKKIDIIVKKTFVKDYRV